MSRHRLVPAALAAALLLAAAPAPGQVPAAPDTVLGGFLRELADSTDGYFGVSAAPLDTAGLDTVLVDTATRPARRVALRLVPSYNFNRVDGNTWGGTLGLRFGDPDADGTGLGRLDGHLARAVGSRTTLGGVRWTTGRLRVAGRSCDLELWAGRRTARLDRDDEERALDFLRAFLSGDDASQYLRSDGFAGSLDHSGGAWRARVAWRDLGQSPLVTTASWNLFDRPLVSPGNLAAATGRTREAGYALSLRWPWLPLVTEVEHQTASRRLGSDFEYRRTRAAAALDLALGRVAALVPQFAYGRLSGDAVPQAAFYLGGTTMRSLHRDERAGTGLAVARLELLNAGDLLETLRLPHSGALPLRAAVFGTASAVWGRDPFTGTVVRGADWPDRRDWRGEVGVSLLFHSALFSPEATLRYSCAWPLGPGEHGPRCSVSVSRALDLLRFPPKDE